MDHSSLFRECLEQLDLPRARAVWGQCAPHLPQPGSDDDLLATLHMARTAAKSLGFKLRAYSHAWLLERGLPSQLPDGLKPSAERLYPRKVSAVGISVNVKPDFAPAGDMIRAAMENAVLEAVEDKKLEDSTHVRARMQDARMKERRALFGRTGLVRVGGG